MKLKKNNRSSLVPAVLLIVSLVSCGKDGLKQEQAETATTPGDTTAVEREAEPDSKELTAADIEVKKELLFEDYYLEDVYEYKDTTRSIKWDEIKRYLAIVENAQRRPEQWGVLHNYKNQNGESKLIKEWSRNEYKRVSDEYGVERYQSVALYTPNDTVTPVRYGRDGWPVHLIGKVGSFYRFYLFDDEQTEWLATQRYVEELPKDSTFFHRIAFVDVGDQNIVTMERESKGVWLTRSTNPCTTGRHKPPHAQETPLGIFAVQMKKAKMLYTHDGSSKIAGYAPYASRFTNGAYIHGVPLNSVNAKIREYSPSLGTIPRSHMCVRNASSHAKFIYDWAKVHESLVIVIE